MAKTEKVENKDQKVEKSSKKPNKSSYSKKKKIKKNILNGIAYVQSTFNNTKNITIVYAHFTLLATLNDFYVCPLCLFLGPRAPKRFSRHGVGVLVDFFPDIPLTTRRQG